jgi:hypothetical protein
VQVEEALELRGRVRRDVLGQGGQLGAHAPDRPVEARLLLLEIAGRDVVVLHLELRVRQQVGAADGDATGDADAVDGEGHGASGASAR